MRKHKPGSISFQSAVMKVNNFGVLQKESTMASKPGVTRVTGGATGSGITAGGSAPTGTGGKVTAKAKTEVERLQMLKVEVGFGLFVRDLTRCLLTHPSCSALVTRRRMFSSSLPSSVKHFYLTRHQWVLPHAGLDSLHTLTSSVTLLLLVCRLTLSRQVLLLLTCCLLGVLLLT